MGSFRMPPFREGDRLAKEFMRKVNAAKTLDDIDKLRTVLGKLQDDLESAGSNYGWSITEDLGYELRIKGEKIMKDTVKKRKAERGKGKLRLAEAPSINLNGILSKEESKKIFGPSRVW